MPSEKGDVGTWVDELDGPERLERAKKKRSEQLKRWERRESNGSSCSEPKKARKNNKNIKFKPNVVILEAAARNDLEEVARLLQNGLGPDLANEDGLTALHQSCIDGCDEMVKYLIEHKANVNACDNELWTPLHAAAACGHTSIVKYLLNNGGDILALNLDGNFPIDVIEDNEKLVQFLEQKMKDMGFDEDAKEDLRQNQGKQLLDDLKDSVANKRSLDIQDENGVTAFHVAAANGWTTVIDFLLENEADFEIADYDGWQAIHAAAAWGHDTVLEVLVASGADLDSKTNDAKTPIDLTEEDEIIELIEELRTKEVKYPRKGKGVRRRRSNNSNSSIKRSSIHEKSELSQADIKAEGAAMFIQLQNDGEADVTTPEEPTSPQQTMDNHFGERTSDVSRDETSSSGYVSEASYTENKVEEKKEPSKKTDPKTKLDIMNYLINEESESQEEKSDKENIKPTNIKTAPIAKPPRLTSSSPKEPSTYINVDIEAVGSNDNIPVSDKSDTTNTSTDNNTIVAKNELNNSVEKRSDTDKRTTLPKLSTSDKKQAPEPPKTSSSKKSKSQTSTSKDSSQKSSKKANRSSKRNSESSSKKSCLIL